MQNKTNPPSLTHDVACIKILVFYSSDSPAGMLVYDSITPERHITSAAEKVARSSGIWAKRPSRLSTSSQRIAMKSPHVAAVSLAQRKPKGRESNRKVLQVSKSDIQLEVSFCESCFWFWFFSDVNLDVSA